MLWMLALLSLFLVVYAHYRLPQHAAKKSTLWPTRIFLVFLGLGVGWALSARYFPMLEGGDKLAMFLLGFGIAHFPSACVLFLKHWRDKPT
ncbi:hypothetical protein [Halomonas korlensis]|uniref:Uncharacterized protein n=1 Tax=Halomonas korlensis TaxID=463301 RepID=A0A1I7IYE8_9GAMM|nr:hypothetical protein [Halomonas korlensis]SFU77960.1 hypothetical protein SAMN04487955_108152 [Halomonas korlensis]